MIYSELIEMEREQNLMLMNYREGPYEEEEEEEE